MAKNGTSGGRSVTEETFQRFVEEVMRPRDVEAIGRFVADEYVDHSPIADLTQRGPEGLKEQFNRLFNAFPDLQQEIDITVANGDLIAWRATHRGTHNGEALMGIAPSGQEFQYTEAHIVRVDDQGKIAEHWGVFDGLGLFQQLGVVMTAASGEPLALPANPPHHEE